MTDARIVFRITLPEQLDPDEFEAFMKDRFFPAVHWQPTRVGAITGLALWRGAGNGEERARTFLMEHGFNGLLDSRLPRVDDESVQADFETYRPYFEPLGPFTERATWSEHGPATSQDPESVVG